MIADRVASIARADMADWVTVAAYMLAAALSARAAGRAEIRHEVRDRAFWRFTLVSLVFLGINELMDLQNLLSAVGREYAKAGGWYEERRQVQYVFIIGLGAVALIAAIAGLRFTSHRHPSIRLAFLGLIFIGTFVLLRAGSFHHFEDLLELGTPEFTWGSIQEMVGILIVAAAAVLYAGKPPRSRRQRSRGRHRRHKQN